MAFYQRIAERRPEARAIVDMGCGPGHLAAALAEAHPEATVTGMDVDPAQVRIARRNHPGTRFQVGSSDATGLPAESADWVLATETYHHWSRPAEALAEIHRILRPGGRFWIVEGCGDMTKAELAAWTGRRPFPGLIFWVRLIFTRHGYRAAALQRDVVERLEASPFGGCDVQREDGWWIVTATKAH